MAEARDFDVAEYLDSPEAIAAYLSEALRLAMTASSHRH